MKYLFFDTETTGLDPSDRIVQIAWLILTPGEKDFVYHNYFIKPDGFSIPEEAFRIHLISTESANERGHEIKPIIEMFLADYARCDIIIGHNVQFDITMVTEELKRLGLVVPEKKTVCTMKESTDYCQIFKPGFCEFKWPKLIELYVILFGETFKCHDAIQDVYATARCFLKLKEIGVINC